MKDLFLSIVAVALVFGLGSTGAAAVIDPEKNPEFSDLLQKARAQIDAKQPAAAVKTCDKVIAAYKAAYGKRREKVFCSRSGPATLGTLLAAASKNQNAIVISSTWADAYFMKGYALQEIGQIAEAQAALEAAVALSPFEAQYLSELAHAFVLQKNWAKAEKHFRAAEDYAPLGPEEEKAQHLARARRGVGYVYVELGKLDAAEQKYRECLAADADDSRAKRELEFVLDLKEKRKKQR